MRNAWLHAYRITQVLVYMYKHGFYDCAVLRIHWWDVKLMSIIHFIRLPPFNKMADETSLNVNHPRNLVWRWKTGFLVRRSRLSSRPRHINIDKYRWFNDPRVFGRLMYCSWFRSVGNWKGVRASALQGIIYSWHQENKLENFLPHSKGTVVALLRSQYRRLKTA